MLFLVPGTSTDDVWQGTDELRLRYCVDADDTEGFDAASSGVSSATMIAAMEAATRAWEAVANVQFTYDPANNDDCGVSSPIPDDRYIKISRDDSVGSACAFAPLSNRTCPGLDGNTIGVDSEYLDNGGPGPGATWAGVMMHELGHVLGLAHEQYHSNGGGCSIDDTRDITAAVDLVSIMGYPTGWFGCALTTPSVTALSLGDGISTRSVYGMPAAWHVATF